MDKEKSQYQSTDKSAIPQFQHTRTSSESMKIVSDLEAIPRIIVSSGGGSGRAVSFRGESLFPKPKPYIPSQSSNHFMSNLIKQRKLLLKRSSGMPTGSRNSVGQSPALSFQPHSQFQQQYGRKMVITSQDLRKKLDARRKIQDEERRTKQLEQPEEKPSVGQQGLCMKKEKVNDGDDLVIILDTHGKGASSTTQGRTKSFSKKSGVSKSAGSSSLLHLIKGDEVVAAASTENVTSSKKVDKRVVELENKEVTKVERVNVVPSFDANCPTNRQPRAMPPCKVPAFNQTPKVTVPYQDKRFVVTEGRVFQGSFVSRSSSGVKSSAVKDDRRTCTSSSIPLLPTPTMVKRNGSGGAWKTYAQARTTEERSSTSIPYQKHRSAKDIRVNNYFNPFNFDVMDESQRYASGLIGESRQFPAKNYTVVESAAGAASKCYETMLTSNHEFDRLCKVTGMEGAMYASERSPASFIATDSKWGNGLMPVMPRILPS